MGMLDSLGLGDFSLGNSGNSGDSGDGGLTPESIALRRKLAEQLLAQGQSETPIISPWQGLNRVAQSWLGAYRLNQLDQQDRAGQKEANQQLINAFAPGISSSAIAGAPANAPAIGAEAPALPASLAQASAAAAGRDYPQAALPSAGTERLPMGMRVNNPGNIKYNPRLGYAGMLGPSQHTDEGDPQMTFDTPQNGMNAAARLALTKYARGQTTAASIVAGEGGWTPGNYQAAANIARMMGVAPNEDLRLGDPARMSTFLRALTMQEHGPASKLYPTGMYQTAANAVRAPAATAAANAAPTQPTASDMAIPPSPAVEMQRRAIVMMGNPRTAALGKQLLIHAATAEAPKQPDAVREYGLALQQGYKGTFMDYQSQVKFGVPLAAATDPNLTGEAFLQSLPPATAAQVKALAEGRQAFPSGFALGKPAMQHLLQQVSQYDPKFDAVNYQARSKTRNDFTSGKSAQTINALNTGMGHLGELSDEAEKLNNYKFTPFNTVANAYENTMGDARVNNFNTVRDKVAEEFTKIYRGSGGSESDIKREIDNLNAANSPDQLHGAIQRMAQLARSKVEALGEQYNQGMGTTQEPLQLVSPASREVFERVGARANGGTPPAGSGGPTAPLAGARQAADGNWYVPDPDRPGKYLMVQH